jgi:hypothetical protein
MSFVSGWQNHAVGALLLHRLAIKLFELKGQSGIFNCGWRIELGGSSHKNVPAASHSQNAQDADATEYEGFQFCTPSFAFATH